MGYMKFLCKFLFYKVLGWREIGGVPKAKKFIVITAPHTSNWDFIIGKLFYCSQGVKPKFMIKAQWFKPPIGWLIRALGGVPVNRENASGSLLPLIKEIEKSDQFILNITPEGTRKKVRKWKKGFYKIAMETGLPLFLGKLDYKNKIIYINGDLFYPTGDYKKDAEIFYQFYKENANGKHPENFDLNCVK
jgi:1-acyl-sn-glycerol-3-phosphate acyltransferase